MSFSENLQTLRKSKNISQEQLAERLDVSRQAVSKWETDGGYPEMDKIVQLCNIFGCTMDELIKGKVSVDVSSERQQYENHFNRFSKGVALGVFLIIIGAALCALLSELGDLTSSAALSEALAPVIMLGFVAVAVPIFIIMGIEDDSFKKNHPAVPEFYTKEETDAFTRRFSVMIASGVAMILIGLLPLVFADYISEYAAAFAAPLYLAIVAAAVMIFVYSGIQHDKYDIANYNARNALKSGNTDGISEAAAAEKRREELSSKICGIIMLTATAVFLTIGFLTNMWHPAWVVFPVGGILCAIVNVALGTKG